MATQEYAASIQGVSIRVTRLDAAGNLLNNAGDSYTTSAFMRISFTPEYEEGDEITEKSANGAICVSYKAPDTLKRITMELAICEPDPELTALISGGLLLRKNLGTPEAPQHRSIGWAAPNVGDDPAGNGVAIEAWSFAVKEGKRSAVLPYFHWVFPYARLRQSGDRVIENGMLATTFEGYGLGNDLFGDGLDGRWEFPIATERPYSYARASWAPTGRNGFYTWHPELNEVVTAKSRVASTGTATLTTEDAHGFAIGETVTVGSAIKSYTATAVTGNGTAATYTIGSHQFVMGQTITVSGFGVAGYNGTFVVTGVAPTTVSVANATTTSETVFGTVAGDVLHGFTGTYEITGVGAGLNPTTFSYALAGADVTLTTLAANGTAVVGPGSRVVTALPDEDTVAIGYNVPGGVDYNADEPIDYVLNSIEDVVV